MGLKSSFNGIRKFLGNQSQNYRMMIVRSAGTMFLFNLTGSYTSIYTKRLGADDITLGYLSSLSSFISMLISIPVGWITDNYNLKKVLGIGMLFNIAMVGFYAFARDWKWILVAMVMNPIAMALMFRSQQVIVINGLREEDRAQGMGLRMITAQIFGLVSPIPAAILVNRFGGLTLEGIRPLFFLRFAGLFLIYGFVYWKLSDILPEPRKSKRVEFFKDFKEVLRGGRKLRSMIIVGALGALVWSTQASFIYIYAEEVKGADELVIGLMSTIQTIATVIFSVPMNRYADVRGRKFSYLSTRPFLWLSFLIAIFAPNPIWLLLAWFFRGVALSGSSAYQTLLLELVPPEQRGRWLGIINTFSALVRIGASILGGYLYHSPYPYLIFVFPLLASMLLRTPILKFFVPETLQK
jgi:MFS family permease